MVAALQEPQAEIQVAESTTRSLGGARKQGAISSTPEVLNLAVHMYLKAIDPFKQEDLNGFVYYLREILKFRIVDINPESLIITVECESPKTLDKLWYDYRTGHLNEIAQEFLATKETLKELALTEVKLKTSILEKEYSACRYLLLRYSGEFRSLY